MTYPGSLNKALRAQASLQSRLKLWPFKASPVVAPGFKYIMHAIITHTDIYILMLHMYEHMNVSM